MMYFVTIGIGDDPNPCNRKMFLDIEAPDPMTAQKLGLIEAQRREPERAKFHVNRCIEQGEGDYLTCVDLDRAANLARE